MTIDHQGACECTSKVATSEMWFGQSGKRQKKCNHARKPLRNYEMSPATTWSTCSSTFVSLRFHHFSSCLLFCLLSAVLFISFFSSSMLFLENKFMRMKCVGFFSGLLTSFFSVQVSTLYGRFVLLHKRNLAENIVEKQGTALIEGLKKITIIVIIIIQ